MSPLNAILILLINRLVCRFNLLYGNLSYDLLQNRLRNQLMSETDLFDYPELRYFDGHVNVSRFNSYNTSDWSNSRFLVSSAKDSDLSKVFTLVPQGPAVISEFGRRCKIKVEINKPFANEFDYNSHRSK